MKKVRVLFLLVLISVSSFAQQYYAPQDTMKPKRFFVKAEILTPIGMLVVPRSTYFDLQVQLRLFKSFYWVNTMSYGVHRFENDIQSTVDPNRYQLQLLKGTSFPILQLP
ncbi:MAG: hypothetical protein NT150_05000 [Bacteroidetes bacterium]|nr:hypothetical protein [Bacteroidota bacterium]